MIHKAIIVAFVLAAAGTAALCIHVHSKGSGSVAYVAVLTVQDVHIYLVDQTVLPYLSRGGVQKHVWLPFWLPLALFGSYPIVALIRGPLRRYHRRQRGLCLKCGFDLIGNIIGTCPKCGEPTGGGEYRRPLGLGLLVPRVRFPGWVCVAGAVTVFLLSVLATVIILVSGNQRSWFATHPPSRAAEWATNSAFIGVGCVVGFMLAKAAYRLARWRRVEYDGIYCPTCDYDLTGNASGVCPECGASAPKPSHVELEEYLHEYRATDDIKYACRRTGLVWSPYAVVDWSDVEERAFQEAREEYVNSQPDGRQRELAFEGCMVTVYTVLWTLRRSLDLDGGGSAYEGLEEHPEALASARSTIRHMREGTPIRARRSTYWERQVEALLGELHSAMARCAGETEFTEEESEFLAALDDLFLHFESSRSSEANSSRSNGHGQSRGV